jgi:NADP-reducing hydrogenase subunit HndA
MPIGEERLMTNKKTNVRFNGTKAQEQMLRDIISSHAHEEGALIGVMQKAQEIYGYLPMEVQTLIAEAMRIPLEEIYGVASFYAQFALNPKGKYKISCCIGTACYVKGAGSLYEKLSEKLGIKSGECTEDGKFSLDACRCIGACGLAPVMTINDEVFGRLTSEKIDQILSEY